MNLRQTAELAAHLAEKADTIDNISRLRIVRSVNAYRHCCRRRTESWQELIERPETSDIETIRPHVIEIFVTEMLTSVWSAVFHAFGHRSDDAEIARAAHDAFLSHQTARHKAMAWMLHRSDTETRAVGAIDVVRRQCERWTDVLLGIASTPVDWHLYAHQPERARDFADENPGTEAGIRNPMLFRSLRTAFAAPKYHFSTPILLHEEVAVSLTSVLPSASRLLANSAPLQFRSRATASSLHFSRLMANRGASDPHQE